MFTADHTQRYGKIRNFVLNSIEVNHAKERRVSSLRVDKESLKIIALGKLGRFDTVLYSREEAQQFWRLAPKTHSLNKHVFWAFLLLCL
jgi:hypothetical protein